MSHNQAAHGRTPRHRARLAGLALGLAATVAGPAAAQITGQGNPPPDAISPVIAPPDGSLPVIPAVAGDPAAAPHQAKPIDNPVATFRGLDKITGRLTAFDVYMNETVQFGALRVTPRACRTAAPGEEPNTVAFVEIDEITLDAKIRRIFTGWMFKASPGLNAVDHPVYDVWLKDCALSSTVPPPPKFPAQLYAESNLEVVHRHPAGWIPFPETRPTPPGATLAEPPAGGTGD